MKTTTFAIFALLFAIVFPAFSTTYFVRSTGGSDDNNGRSVEQAFATLTKMFSNSPALVEGDVIDISGTFNYNESKQILVSITIQGTDKNTAIIQGTSTKLNLFRIGNVTIPPNGATPTVTIENVTIQNMDYFDGTSSFSGGVIGVWPNSTLICKNVNFLNNKAYIGGAINISDANATFEDCYFYGNISAKVGTSPDGGAINYTTQLASTLMINRCLFENNSSDRMGSALRYRSNLSGSTAVSSTFTLQNSTFTGNTAKVNSGSSSAGTVYIEGNNTTADVKLINNTIAYNSNLFTTASAANAGLYIGGLSNQVTLINNILFSNFNSFTTTGPKSVSISNGTNIFLKESRNNITDYALATYDWTAKTTNGATMASGNISAIVNGTSAGQLGLAVNAAALADNGGATKTLSLSATSIAVNGGYTTGVPNVDQRNLNRDATPDIGAYELIVKSTPIITWVQDLTGLTTTDNPLSLTLTATSNAGVNGSDITYTSNNPDVVSVTGNTLTIVAAGTATITAHQNANNYFNAAVDVQQTANVDGGTATGLRLNNEDIESLTITSNGVNVNTKGTLQVISLTGKIMKTIDVSANQIVHLAKGTYIIRMITNKGVFVQKSSF